MKILLTDEEIRAVIRESFPNDYSVVSLAAKAQLIKLIEYIDNKGGWTFPGDWDDIKKEVE